MVKGKKKRRKKVFFFVFITLERYLLRPPMWGALKEKLALFAFLGQIPLVGYLFQLLHDMIESLSRYYFFSSSQ